MNNIHFRHDWTLSEIEAIYQQPLMDLLYQAHTIHREQFNPNAVQAASLISIRTGSCPEDCSYCPQSVHHQTDVEPEKMMGLEAVIAAAKKAKAMGATRFCMGSAVRKPTNRQIDAIIPMIQAVNALNLETCLTTGMLTEDQAEKLKLADLDYYNHNLDTSPEYYPEIITTRTYNDRLETLAVLQKVGIKVCCGGILGLGETLADRFSFLQQLSQLNPHPQSVPINQLIPTEGTPLANQKTVDPIEFVRIIATARILMPGAYVRLSGWRKVLSDETQALCFFAGANSIFIGETLFTRKNALPEADQQLFEKLGLQLELSPKYSEDNQRTIPTPVAICAEMS